MNDHPIQITADPDDYTRSRLTTFFRMLMVIPHIVVLYVYAIGAMVCVVVGFFWALFTGQLPGWAYKFLRFNIIYSTRVSAYSNLLTDQWPSFGASGTYPVEAVIPELPTKMRRWGILFRIVLIYPALFFSMGIAISSMFGWMFAWVTGVVLGRVPVGITRFNLSALQFQTQLAANANFMTSRYPSWAEVHYLDS